ncbi:S9 family peptidase [Panacibacter sp. DH6]|uniref:Acyl-peptide hydrolase n=1 Tax=Panacibacter microcysteis TaxID=2793269 RepID=A0A931E9F8_9BACT|nr:S9 family peptidase [Panacibacter microcysteis]MBG9376141.1 S9 family peptidase [Panacibacter microcysteis]
MRKALLFFAVSFIVYISHAQNKRPLKPEDVYRLQEVSGAQVSPDGKWVVYVVSTVDTGKDARDNNLWMISWDGKEKVQLTFTKEDESAPKFSPDGRYLSFLSSRKDGTEDKTTEGLSQLWLLDRRGGEAKKISAVTGDIDDYVWRPDGKKMLMVVKDQDFADTAESGIRKPYVMDRYHFKQDYIGYLDRRAKHLYMLDVETGAVDTLTNGVYDETEPDFSPDGKQIVFTSNRTADPDKNENTDIYAMDATPHAPIKQLTSWAGQDHHPFFSPDGKSIAYLQSSSDLPYTMYGHDILAVINAGGGAPNLLSKAVDRPVTNIAWSNDGKYIATLMEDDRSSNVVAFDISTGTMKKLSDGKRATFDLAANPAADGWVALMSEPQLPFELFVVENSSTRRLTHTHDAFLAPLQLPTVESFQSKSKDGTLVSGILYKPANAVPGQKLPFVLYIHGGPVAQDDYEFDIVPQSVASAGYAVAQVNYRGSSGRGVDYIKAIYADWGNKEVMDLMGAVDYLAGQGIIDENRMGLGGWSYGGILTDYIIASNTRFKAACSGAGSANQLSIYGTDQYITQYEMELGVPWKNIDKWIKISYPFFKADKIKTPTLFMASQNDFNVPVAGAEQMYQALKSNGIPTQLIIYPKQNHGLNIPSYEVFKYKNYINWFNKYLQ